MPRFTVIAVRSCACGSSDIEVEWSTTGERTTFHHGSWPQNLTNSERTQLRALHRRFFNDTDT